MWVHRNDRIQIFFLGKIRMGFTVPQVSLYYVFINTKNIKTLKYAIFSEEYLHGKLGKVTQ